MATKTITIKEDAYNKLKARKKENESFSDVINREFGKHSIWEIAGILSDGEADELEENVKEFRREMDERWEETAERMNK